MNRIPLLFCALLMLASSVVGQMPVNGLGPDPSWPRYKVKGEEFSAALPTMPLMSTINNPRKSDGKPRLERRLRTSFGTVYYSIEAFENPEPKQSLKEFVDEYGFNTEYDRASERKLTIDGFRGLEYTSANKTLRVQFLATENHLYRFVASGVHQLGDAAVNNFFSSIKLSGEVDGIEVPDDGDVFSGKEIDSKARLLAKPEPTYTSEARANHLEGVVILKCVFAKTGKVEHIRVVAGLPFGLTDRAIEAAKQIKFIPAMKDGQPVSMWMQLEYHFSPY